LAGRLTGVDVVVHTDLDLAPDSEHRARRAFNVRGAQTVLTAAAAGRVGRVVLITSTMVYGAKADNPVPLAEDTALAADIDSSVAGDLLEIEQLAGRSLRSHPGLVLTVKGCEPRWQFCHIDDLISALELAVAGEVTGEFAVGCDGWLDQQQVF